MFVICDQISADGNFFEVNESIIALFQGFISRIGLHTVEQMSHYGATWAYYNNFLSTGLGNQMYKSYTLKSKTSDCWDAFNFKVIVTSLGYVQILSDTGY